VSLGGQEHGNEMREALFLAAIVLALRLVVLLGNDHAVPSFAPLYSAYALTLLVLAGCSLLIPVAR